MTIKEKILAALKTKYKNKGFSDKSLEELAEHLAANTTDEAEIDNVVNGAESLLNIMQSEADRRAAAAVTKSKKDATEKRENEGGEPVKKDEPEAKSEDAPPAWAKGFADKIDSLANIVAALQEGKTAETRKQSLEKALEKADSKFKERELRNFERMSFKDDEEFKIYLTEVEKDAGEFTSEDLAAAGRPIIGNAGKIGDNELSPAMKQIVNERKAAAAQPQK